LIILDAKNLIDHLLVVDRNKRMTADEILLHPWIMSLGQSKTIRNMDELKANLRLKYETKIKEYAVESTGP
jgi:serine/threonine protein kinase